MTEMQRFLSLTNSWYQVDRRVAPSNNIVANNLHLLQSEAMVFMKSKKGAEAPLFFAVQVLRLLGLASCQA